MKKLGAILLIILTGMLLSACGGGSASSTGDSRDTTVQPGDVVLSWTPPSSRADGSYLPLNELQGYRIYYGTTSGNLSMLVDLNDDTITEYPINNLPSGSYYFAVTAYDADGMESGFSNVINKDV